VVVAVLLAWLILHEAITPAKLAGATLIAVGLLVIARG
jgi:transporter family protein